MTSRPEWLSRFVDRVLASVTALSIPGQFNCHTYFNDTADEWEVTLFARSSQFGGRLKGLSQNCPIAVDVFELASCFSQVDGCGWQSARIDSEDDVGPHLSIEGDFDGHRVWLRMPGQVPKRLVSADECFSVGDTLNLN